MNYAMNLEAARKMGQTYAAWGATREQLIDSLVHQGFLSNGVTVRRALHAYNKQAAL